MGYLGDNTTTDRLTPTQTASLGDNRTAVSVSTKRYHTCALLDDGSVSCWGRNHAGQLGDNTTTDRLTPTQTAGFGGAVFEAIRTSQTECSVGTYQPSSGQTSCIEASAGNYVDTNGSIAQTPCSPGTWQSQIGQVSCMNASAGHYVATNGSETQTP